MADGSYYPSSLWVPPRLCSYRGARAHRGADDCATVRRSELCRLAPCLSCSPQPHSLDRPKRSKGEGGRLCSAFHALLWELAAPPNYGGAGESILGQLLCPPSTTLPPAPSPHTSCSMVPSWRASTLVALTLLAYVALPAQGTPMCARCRCRQSAGLVLLAAHFVWP